MLSWSRNLCRLYVSLSSRPSCFRGEQVSEDFGLGGGAAIPICLVDLRLLIVWLGVH